MGTLTAAPSSPYRELKPLAPRSEERVHIICFCRHCREAREFYQAKQPIRVSAPAK